MKTLYVVATPIGNLEDITIRAIKTLLSVTVVACEDTRRTGILLKLLKERYQDKFDLQTNYKKIISVRDWNEAGMEKTILRELENNDVALVSDAGTPLLSDPGFKIVRAVREAGGTVIPIPGPFAGAAAASAAGLPTNKIMFWGFLPRKWDLLPGVTNIVYESPIRTEKTINTIKDRYPESQIVIANELTKIHEKIMDFQEWEKGKKIKGEVTILIYLPVKSEIA